MEKPAADVMERKPRPPNEPFFTRARGARIVAHGLLIASVMVSASPMPTKKPGIEYARATVFYVTTFSQLFFAFACRSQRYTLPQLGFFSNPFLLGAIVLSGLLQIGLLYVPLTASVFFGTAPQFGSDWMVIFVLALTPVSIVEITKIIQSRRKK